MRQMQTMKALLILTSLICNLEFAIGISGVFARENLSKAGAFDILDVTLES